MFSQQHLSGTEMVYFFKSRIKLENKNERTLTVRDGWWVFAEQLAREKSFCLQEYRLATSCLLGHNG